MDTSFVIPIRKKRALFPKTRSGCLRCKYDLCCPFGRCDFADKFIELEGSSATKENQNVIGVYGTRGSAVAMLKKKW